MKIIWLTGQPGAGKTEIAKEIIKNHPHWVNVDGDDIREIFNNKDYSMSGRVNNIKLAQSITEFLYRKGNNVVVSLVSPYREIREEFKNKIGKDLIEVYLHTSEDRGKNEFYVKNYEKPNDNYIDFDTTDKTAEESVKLLNSIIYFREHENIDNW